jgi:hypothetical protein
MPEDNSLLNQCGVEWRSFVIGCYASDSYVLDICLYPIGDIMMIQIDYDLGLIWIVMESPTTFVWKEVVYQEDIRGTSPLVAYEHYLEYRSTLTR